MHSSAVLSIEAGQALLRLADGAVYLVKQGDVLWGGRVTIVAIDKAGVQVRFADNGEVTLEKITLSAR